MPIVEGIRVLPSIALVRLHDPPARLALHVAAADVFAVASLQHLLGPGYVAAAAAEILAALVAGTAAVTLSAKEFVFPRLTIVVIEGNVNFEPGVKCEM